MPDYYIRKYLYFFILKIKIKAFLFNFQSLLTVGLFLICTCAYIRQFWPSLIEPYKDGFFQ